MRRAFPCPQIEVSQDLWVTNRRLRLAPHHRGDSGKEMGGPRKRAGQPRAVCVLSISSVIAQTYRYVQALVITSSYRRATDSSRSSRDKAIVTSTRASPGFLIRTDRGGSARYTLQHRSPNASRHPVDFKFYKTPGTVDPHPLPLSIDIRIDILHLVGYCAT